MPYHSGCTSQSPLTDIQVKPCLHALAAEDPMAMHLPMALTAMRDKIISLGLMGEDDFDGLVARVADHLARPGTMTFSMVQVIGRSAV